MLPCYRAIDGVVDPIPRALPRAIVCQSFRLFLVDVLSFGLLRLTFCGCERSILVSLY